MLSDGGRAGPAGATLPERKRQRGQTQVQERERGAGGEQENPADDTGGRGTDRSSAPTATNHAVATRKPKRRPRGVGGTARGNGIGEIALVAALYPSVWSIAQIGAGHLSDSVGRKRLIAVGMLVQAGALAILAAGGGELASAVVAATLLGLGTALVYPTLIAAISDAVDPVTRAPVLGVYRFWRDSGYVFGGIIAGTTADALGFGGAIAIVAGLTAMSGIWVVIDMPADAATA